MQRQLGPQMAHFPNWCTHSDMCFLLSMTSLELIFCMIWTHMSHIIHKKAFLDLT